MHHIQQSRIKVHNNAKIRHILVHNVYIYRYWAITVVIW